MRRQVQRRPANHGGGGDGGGSSSSSSSFPTSTTRRSGHSGGGRGGEPSRSRTAIERLLLAFFATLVVVVLAEVIFVAEKPPQPGASAMRPGPGGGSPGEGAAPVAKSESNGAAAAAAAAPPGGGLSNLEGAHAAAGLADLAAARILRRGAPHDTERGAEQGREKDAVVNARALNAEMLKRRRREEDEADRENMGRDIELEVAEKGGRRKREQPRPPEVEAKNERQEKPGVEKGAKLQESVIKDLPKQVKRDHEEGDQNGINEGDGGDDEDRGDDEAAADDGVGDEDDDDNDDEEAAVDDDDAEGLEEGGEDNVNEAVGGDDKEGQGGGGGDDDDDEVAEDDDDEAGDSDRPDVENPAEEKAGIVNLARKDPPPPAEPRRSLEDVLVRAGAEVTPEVRRTLPSAEEAAWLYGDGEPVVLGLDRCEEFRRNVRGEDRFIGVAGIFNTGTNLLSDLLTKNCYIPEKVKKFGENKIGMRGQVPWGKHSPMSWRGHHVAMGGADDIVQTDVLPIVVVKDPLTWMTSMCRHKYAANWLHTEGHCPNLVPVYPDERKDERVQGPEGGHGKTIPVHVKYRETNVTTHESLAGLWNDWYRPWAFEADFPRVIVRFEDLLLRAEEVVTTVCHCGGGDMRPGEFRYDVETAKHGAAHKGASGMTSAIVRYTNATLRLEPYHERDVEYANQALRPDLMDLFGYRYGVPRIKENS